MSAPVTPQTNQEPVIKVASSTDTKDLASTIANALSERDTVKLRAIGAGAINQAVKAMASARGYVAARGQDLIFRPGWETTTDIDRPGTSGSKELSCIVFYVSVQ